MGARGRAGAPCGGAGATGVGMSPTGAIGRGGAAGVGEAGRPADPARMTSAGARAWLPARYGPDLDWLFEAGLRAWDGWDSARRRRFLLAAGTTLRPRGSREV
jgi:hypothetical protein